jgi:hypothetical protein
MNKFPLKVRVLPDGNTIKVKGRDAWALESLIQAGPAGCTPITHPGPRWSHYIWKIKQAGIHVETLHERHGGPFPGNHGRYVLRSKVEVLEDGASA